MTASFVVYIDESGDEGFVFKEGQGSTHWFVLSAVITEKATDLETVKLIDEVRLKLGRKPEDHNPLHFRNLKHEHRLPFVHRLSQAKLQTVTIMIHKPSIVNVELFQKRFLLYFYASRLLLERVSWYCRNHKTPHTSGDGTAEINFSNRGGMKYDEFRAYMEQLKIRTQVDNVQVDWNVIKSDQIIALSPKLMGMQIADAVASSFFYGIELNQYGFAEDRYVRMLKPLVYNHRGRYSGYGLKLWPNENIKQQSHARWLVDLYNF